MQKQKNIHIYSILILLFLLGIASCKSQKKLERKADASFEQGEYFKAVEFYEKLLEGDISKSAKANYQYKAGECYRMINNTRKAETMYRRASKDKVRDKEMFYWYGSMLLQNEKYDDAEQAFLQHKNNNPKDERTAIALETCKHAKELQDSVTTRYIVENMRVLNSREHDFAPLYIASDYSSVYFTSSRVKEDEKQKTNLVSGMFYTSVYESRMDRKGQWTKPTLLEDTTINSEFDNGVMSLSADGMTLYVTQCREEAGKHVGCQIYSVSQKGGSWVDIKREEIVPDSISIGHPSLSYDGLELYFSARMKGGYGGSDIWKVQRKNTSDTWGKPINLGPDINTEGEEMYPFIRKDGVLYFSSDGHVGFGGLDIFRATRNDDGSWYIINMQSPINSSQDDFGIVFQGATEKGMFSSNRKGGRGQDDIYSFELPELIVKVKGVILDASNKKPIPQADVTLIGSDGSMINAQSKIDGSYSFKLQQYTDYLIIASSTEFLKKKIKFTTNNVFDNTTFTHNVELITMNKPVEIPNIFYDLGKWTLNESSKQALTELSKLLEDNPNITIEIGAHTDMIGDSLSNMSLSKKRAQAIIDYLSAQGYDSDRLVARGFGENVPVIVSEQIALLDTAFKIGTALTQDFVLELPAELQEKANQINRRTELKILTTDYIPKPEYFERQKKYNKKL